MTETKFLELIVRKNKIRMNLEKIRTIMKWLTSRHLKQVQVFIDFCNFYRRFIKNFSKIVKSLVRLIKKNILFEWSQTYQIVFEEMKKMIVEALILTYYNRDKQIYLNANSSDYVSVEILFQMKNDEFLHSVAFFSKNLLSAKCNYEIYNKKLLAIVKYFEQWRLELKASNILIKILTNYKSLENFMTIKKLNRRQARWIEFLVEFNFIIIYRSEKKNDKVDVFIKRARNKSQSKNDERQKHQRQIILIFDRLDLFIYSYFDMTSIRTV